MVNLGRGREQFLKSSRSLRSLNLPLLFVSVFLWFSVMWKLVVVSVLRGFGVSESGVSGWGGGSFCGLAVWEAQWVSGHRGARRCVRDASPGMGWFSSCFPRVPVGVRA